MHIPRKTSDEQWVDPQHSKRVKAARMYAHHFWLLQPGRIASIIGTALPTSSNFFINYVSFSNAICTWMLTELLLPGLVLPKFDI